jgi:cell division inhibitor SepF
MGLMDEIRKLRHPYSNNDNTAYDDYDDEDEEEDYEEEPAPARRRNFTTRGAAATETAAERSTPVATTGAGRVTSINHSTNMQVVLVKPERYDQVSDIAARLRNKQSIVLNLETTDKNVARRVIDFLSGTAYALDGNIRKIAAYTYLVIPFNVEMVGETLEETETDSYI